MKKIMITIVLTLIIIGGTIIYLTDNTEQNDWSVSTEMPSEKIEDTAEETFYSEGNENLNYNYITNISALEAFDMPIEFYEEIGDICDNLLETAGVVGEKIKVTEVTSDYDVVKIVFTSDSGAQINLTYNLKTGEHNEYLDVQQK